MVPFAMAIFGVMHRVQQELMSPLAILFGSGLVRRGGIEWIDLDELYKFDEALSR